jgi:starch phosphorylase
MHVRQIIVDNGLPEELKCLETLGKNLWHTWNPSINRLFQALEPQLWEEGGHNPIHVLANLSADRIREIVDDPTMMKWIDEADRALDEYISNTGLYSYNLDRPIDYRMAYFSMEYGLTESIPIYSGGLGVLAGDHLKSASNLCIPLIGLGLLYQRGYFSQYLNVDGWQQESYKENDFYNMPMSRVPDENGNQAVFELDIGDSVVKVLIWKVQVGRISLYLLDTNHPDNSDADRRITAELYGGDPEARIRQEIVLGIGGARALHLLGLWPYLYHLNEGHAAFAPLERIRQTTSTYKVPFDTAREAVAASTVFTTHTPVPAGIDIFPAHLMERYFSTYVQSLGISMDELLALGRGNPSDKRSDFSMAVLAMRLSNAVNAVSELHGRVSRNMWSGIWPSFDESDVPIGHVTNGVHIPSYLSKEMTDLFERYLGEDWVEEPDNEKIWSRAENIPHDELWMVHEIRRERLVALCRRRIRHRTEYLTASPSSLKYAGEILNPEALTIGFARRFAPYKRAGLLFSDPERLLRIVSDKRRPVQFIFAGKAHPRDETGKELIKMVVHQSRMEGFRRHLVFLEDYDINLARYLVQGVDVWLNNPRRPLEACGTSGMKAAANGALNLSVLDGWWPEAYDGKNGWAIGHGEEYEDTEYQDRVEAELLYSLLEKEVIPLFFDRGPGGLPHGWIEMMKHSIASICVHFNSHRMIEEYMLKYYYPGIRSHQVLGENRFARAKMLSEWKKRAQHHWPNVQVIDVSEERTDPISLGEQLQVEASVRLGELSADEVTVDLCHGPIDPATDAMTARSITVMELSGRDESGNHTYTGTIPCEETGVYGYNIRVLPFHPHLLNPLSMNLAAWG